MTTEETLTADQKIKLSDALEKITIEMLEDLDYGEQIELNDTFCLYHYTEDDCIVVNLTDEWDEVYQVLFSDEEIIFEAL